MKENQHKDKIVKALKLVRKGMSGRFLSAYESQYAVEYKLNNWTYPTEFSPNRALFVCDCNQLNDLIMLTKQNKSLFVFECLIKMADSKFRFHSPHNGKFMPKSFWPKGTIFAYAVKLTKQINP